jgi:hypothetical protein
MAYTERTVEAIRYHYQGMRKAERNLATIKANMQTMLDELSPAEFEDWKAGTND